LNGFCIKGHNERLQEYVQVAGKPAGDLKKEQNHY